MFWVHDMVLVAVRAAGLILSGYVCGVGKGQYEMFLQIRESELFEGKNCYKISLI